MEQQRHERKIDGWRMRREGDDKERKLHDVHLLWQPVLRREKKTTGTCRKIMRNGKSVRRRRCEQLQLGEEEGE
ncbi:hypothetical protein Csa_023138 [Cucumis sativus]|uniref:Uncharacterized protein n=1 Tax=Cucumis sativus TaxID=3659 RepID=A0A0A0KPW9_CUCSA|nr:hypothetical protein Csa_023138 [Cucumis sativus]